jgi:hypothetical protein
MTLARDADRMAAVKARRAGAWVALASLAWLAACGGEDKVEGPPQGSCTQAAGNWACTATAEASDSGAPLTLLSCPSSVGSGSCPPNTTIVDTTNPNMPAHYSDGDCFECTSSGLGVYWTCGSNGWQVQAVYSCP